jgi:hypothetical protein
MNKALAVFFLCIIACGLVSSTLVQADTILLLHSDWNNSNGSVSDNGVWSYVAVSGNPPNYGDMSVVQAPGQVAGDYALQITSSTPYSGYSSGWDECIDFMAPWNNPTPVYACVILSADVLYQNLPTEGYVNCLFIMSMYANSPVCELLVGAQNVNGVVVWKVFDEGNGLVSNIQVTPGVWHNIVLMATAGSPFTYSISVDGQQIADNIQAPYGCNSFNIAGVGGDCTCSGIVVNIDNVNVWDPPPEAPDNQVPEAPLGIIVPVIALAGATALFVVFKKRYVTTI